MLYAYPVYDLILDVLRKDGRGKAVSIDEYNNLSVVVNKHVFEDFYDKFEGDLESSDCLGTFKVFNEDITLVADAQNTSAVGTLPTDYYHVIGRPKTISGSTIRWVDVVTAQEHARRQNDYLTQATAINPTCQIGGQDANDNKQIRVYPYTTNLIYLDYLREPVTPYLDYYVNNTTLVTTYMDSGDTVSVPAGSTYRDGTAGGGLGIPSLTQDWEWSDDELPLIIAKFLQLLGIAYPDELLLQAGMANENKITQK